MLSAVMKFVVMVLNMSNNVMMEILNQVMDAQLLVKKNLDGSVQEDLQISHQFVENSSLIEFN